LRKGRQTPADVNVQVKGKNLSISASLRDQIVKKMQRLDKYLVRINGIEVEVWTEKTRDAGQVCHINAMTHATGRTLRVTASDVEMLTAVDDAVDKLYRQLNRTKEKMKAHSASKPSEAIASELTASDLSLTSEDHAAEPVILVEYLQVKPQFEDEAIIELESLKRTFYVFLNARNEQVNVLYRHADGTYGLIEPRVG
jgi:putative sigma-54 modulation protein